MKKKFALIFIIVFTIIKSNAQVDDELAFSKSYTYEYDTKYDKAIEALQVIQPKSYQVNLRLGWLYYLKKEYAKSESFYRKAIEMEPQSIEAKYGLVLPLAANSSWNSVLLLYLEIVKIDPLNSTANYRIASIYYTRKQYELASTYLSKLLKLYPFDYDINLLAGKIAAAQGKIADAKKYFTRALEYNPQSEEAQKALK
jgi:tetratricopeptide (TPR) repeat protein